MSLISKIDKFLKVSGTQITEQFIIDRFTTLQMMLGWQPVKLDVQLNSLKNYSYTCMQLRALHTSKMRTVIGYEKKRGEIEEVQNHWLQSLLDEPNRLQKYTWRFIKQQIRLWLDYSGNCYLWTPTFGNKTPVQMWILPSNLVRVMTGHNFIEAYRFQSQGAIIDIPPNEICHFMETIPSSQFETDLFLGKPKIIQAISNAINADESITKYIFKYFDREAVPPLLYKTRGRLSDTEWQMKKARWNETMGTNKLVAILEGDDQVEPLTATTSEQSAGVVRDSSIATDTIKRLCAAFQTPYAMVMSEYDNRAAARSILANYYDNTVDPLCQDRDDRLVQHFAQWDVAIKIKTEKYTSIEPELQLQENNWKFKTINEWRSELQLPPIEADQMLIPSSLVAVPLTAPEPPPPPEPKVVVAPNPLPQEQPLLPPQKFFINKEYKALDKNYIFWKKWDVDASKSFATLEFTLKKCLKGLKQDVLKGLKNNVKNYQGTYKVKYKKVIKAIELNSDLFDVEKWMDKLNIDTTPDRVEAVKSAIKHSLQDIGIQWDSIETEYEKELKDIVKNSTSKITDSINTIQDDLKSTVQNLIADNTTLSEDDLYSKLMDKVKYKFEEVYVKSRIANIARTTTTFLTTNTQKDIYKKHGFGYSWMSQRDGIVRPSHRKADGQQPDEDGYFSVGNDRMQHPSGGELAEENCFCRCYLFPVRKGK